MRSRGAHVSRALPGLLLAAGLGTGCSGGAPPAAAVPASWDETVAAARGQSVVWTMWQGDPYINAYVRDWVTPRLRDEFGIDLVVVGGQGAQLTSRLMTEIEAGRTRSATDIVWINGETFYQLRQLGALAGPFVADLPNAAAIDFSNPFIARDFQQPVEGFECPWGNVQLAIIHDTRRVADPPRTRAALAAWVRAHPGRFTFDSSFTGMTFLKSLLIDVAGGPGALDGPFDEARYGAAAAALWDSLRSIRRYFWKAGRTFPEGVAQLHQLFAAGEVDFTMSNNDGEVDNKVLQGLFPETARAYVLDGGTIQNTHYLGIVSRAEHPEGARVVINFLISPEAQLHKLEPGVWGDGTVLDVSRLPETWRARFAAVPGRRFAPPRAEIQPHALQELAPEYMIRISDDFRTEILER